MSDKEGLQGKTRPSKESIDFFSPETEFYALEKSLMTKTTYHDVFVTVSCWISDKFHCRFVLFSAEEERKIGRIKYFYCEKNATVYPDIIIEERLRAKVPVDSIFIHPSGGFSLPFSYGSIAMGHLYVGPCNSETVSDSLKMRKKLLPVARILGRTLLFLETEAVRQEKNKLQYAFSRYVSPDVVQNILDNPAMMNLGGEKQFLSVIFTDLRDFTTLSENMDPVTLVRVLNLYLNEMSQVIIALGGTIDKFEGDAIMAFFGAPHKFDDHAVRCCLAALRMKRMETLINSQLLAEKLIEKPLFTRIGINSGDMVVGNIGSLQRIDYTIIGKNVNLASRIETANKEFDTSVLISGETYNLVRDSFDCRFVDKTLLRGFSESVKLYELVAEKRDTILKYRNITNAYTTENLETVDSSVDDNLPELEKI